jgi:hypothetical protein
MTPEDVKADPRIAQLDTRLSAALATTANLEKKIAALESSLDNFQIVGLQGFGRNIYVPNNLKQPGPKGEDGVDGTDGTDGVDGVNGADGTDGVDGVTPTFVIGTVTTGSPSDVTISGGPAVYTLDFVLEQGPVGPTGPPPSVSTTTIHYLDCESVCQEATVLVPPGP